MSVISSSFRSRMRASIERPVARLFGRLRLTPNALTLIGFGIAVVGGVLVAADAWVVGGLVVAFGAIFDLFDGALARATNSTSRFGAFLDSTFDRAGEAVVYIGIGYAYVRWDAGLGAGLAMIAMAAAFMVSYTRAKAESLGFSSGAGIANIGLAPREVRTVILVLGLVAAPLYESGIGFGDAAPFTPLLALTLIAVLATVTTIQRILFVYRQSKNGSDQQEVNR